MTQQERVAEIIVQLKQIRIERNLSLQDVHDLVLDAGGYTSFSSVKRVFAEGSEKQGFRYHDTIQPIARALLDVTKETPENNDVTPNEIDALKNVILLKDSIIQDLRNENEALSIRISKTELEAQERLVQTRDDFQRKVDYLLGLVEHHRKELDYLRLENDRKAKIIDKFLDN
jgi:hypothetical protein